MMASVHLMLAFVQMQMLDLHQNNFISQAVIISLGIM